MIASALVLGLLIGTTDAGATGLWTGGFGHMEGEELSWKTFGISLEAEKDGELSGTFFSAGTEEEVDVKLGAEGEITFAVKLDGKKHRFKAARDEDVLRGTCRVGRETYTALMRREASVMPAELEGLEGVYRAADGRRFLVRRGGRSLVLSDFDGPIRSLFHEGEDRFVAGPALVVPDPIEWRVAFVRASDDVPAAFTLESADGEVRAERVYAPRREPFRYASFDGTKIVGELTLPKGEGPHPGVVYVHGSGRATRHGAATWSLHLAHLGFAVLAVDKRGVGESGGKYELPDGGHDNRPHMERRAKDVLEGVRALGKHAAVDAERIGLLGGSQAGWVNPMASHTGEVKFTITVSGGATALGYEGRFSDVAGEGESRRDRPSVEDLLVDLRDYKVRDPDFREAFAAQSCPGLWLYGAQDRSNPSQLCIEEIEGVASEHDKDFTIQLFPQGNHSLLVARYGGSSETRLLATRVPGMFAAVEDWLELKGLLPKP